MDTQLRELFGVIIQRDGKRLARLIADHPVLPRIALEVGASRSASTEFFLDEIKHYVYGGDTALHVAAAAHWPEGVALLLEAGADVKVINRHQQTALHYACAGGPGLKGWNPKAQAQVIQMLLDAGADPDVTAKGVAPLHTAVRNRCALAVETLLAGGADPTLENKNGSTPAHLATVTSGRGGTGDVEAKAQQAKIIELLKAARSRN
jgi:ankyrin repeat protein